MLVASRDSCETQTLRNLTKRLICAGNNHDWIQKCDEDLGSPLVCLSNEKMVSLGNSCRVYLLFIYNLQIVPLAILPKPQKLFRHKILFPVISNLISFNS